MTRQLFAQNVGKTSRLRRIMLTACDKTEQQDIARIAKHAVLKAAEKIGQDQFMRLFLRPMRKLAKFAILISRLKNFMQTAVLQTAQKNTVVDAKVAYLQKQNKSNQNCTYQNLNEDPQAQKISFPASLTTPYNANNTLGLTLILFTCLSFMPHKKAFVRCRELR
jgi:hypothetical protein